MFDENGELYFPAGAEDGAPNPNHPYWIPEFIGDTIVVNGKAWPYLEVEPRRYRFLLLNGSNSRTYELFFAASSPRVQLPPFWVIGTDGGYLDAPARIGGRAGRRRAVGPAGLPSRFVIMPGERYEVIVDFGGLAPGTRLVLRNRANAPFPDGDPSDEATVGQIMEYRVVACASGRCGAHDDSYDPAAGTALRTGAQKIVRLAEAKPALTRSLTLNEVMREASTEIDPVTGEPTEYEGGPLEVLLNNTEYVGESPRRFGDSMSVTTNGKTTTFFETPEEGTTEVWEIVNLTADAHPIHLHLVEFQLVNRQQLDVDEYLPAYEAAFPGGEFMQGFGPPLDYRAERNPLSGGKLGGNPDVTPFLRGAARAPEPYESGWKDTVVAYPGQVTRIAIRWAPTDLPLDTPPARLHFAFDVTGDGSTYNYVWHCHILDHEDNEMMRPHTLRANPQAPSVRQLLRGVDY